MNKWIFLSAIFLSAYTCTIAQGTSMEKTPNTIINPLNDSTNLKAYTGIYLMKDNPYIDEISLFVKEGRLMSITPENEEIILQPTDETDTFFISMINAKVIFTRENNLITGVKAKVQGKEMTGIKK